MKLSVPLAVSSALAATLLTTAIGTATTFQSPRALAAGDLGLTGPVRVMPPRGHYRAFNPNSAMTLTWYGGPVQHTPHLYLVYWKWSSDPQGEQNYLQTFLNGVGGSSWNNTVTQYYDGSGNIVNSGGLLMGIWNDTTNSRPNHPSQNQLAAEASRAASHFGDRSVNANYIVATPHGASQRGFGTQWCAYHSYSSTPWTYMPYISDAGYSCGAGSVNNPGTLDGVSIVGGHEVAEAETDPNTSNIAWYNNSYGEIGDECAWTNLQNTSFSTGTFPTQPLWSNQSNACVQNGP